MADPNGTRPPGSTKMPTGMTKVARVAPILSNPSLGSVSSTSGGGGSLDMVVDSNRLVGGGGVRQKKSSFQITSVTVGSRLSNDGGEDSADDLDESHTEDLSSDVLDVSKTTDYECSSEDAFSSIKDDGGGGGAGSSSIVHQNQTQVNVSTMPSLASQTLKQEPSLTMFTTSTTTSSNQSSNVSVTVVEAANMPMSVVQHPEIQWQNRFRVVKIETSEPFRRGRWLCMDFLDPPPASSTQSDVGDRESSLSYGGGGGIGSGNSSGTGSMPHGESLIMETAAAGMLQQQHPVAASWSAESSAMAAVNQAIAATGYGQDTMTHGMTYASGMMEAPLYPVSIILQTQQQGNLDFTNTALHMQGRTAYHPRPTHVNPNNPQPPNPQQQQQQQQQQQPGTMPTAAVVAPPGSDFHGVISSQPNVQQTRDYIQQQPELQAVTHNTAVIQQQQQQQQQHHQMAPQSQDYILPNAAIPTMIQMDHTVATTEYVSNPNPLNPPPPSSNPNSQQTIIFPATVPPPDYGILTQQAQNLVGTVPVVASQSQPTAAVAREQIQQQQQQTFQQQQQQQQPLSNSSAVVQVVTDSGVTSSQESGGVVISGNAAGAASSVPQQQPVGVQAQSSTSTTSVGGQQSSTNAVATGTATSPPVVETSGGEEGEGESASGASTVAIDNKIEQAMDLVKSHLMFAVREEVDVLKEKITELMDRINQLEYENNILKASASPETLAKLSSSQASNSSTT